MPYPHDMSESPNFVTGDRIDFTVDGETFYAVGELPYNKLRNIYKLSTEAEKRTPMEAFDLSVQMVRLMLEPESWRRFEMRLGDPDADMPDGVRPIGAPTVKGILEYLMEKVVQAGFEDMTVDGEEVPTRPVESSSRPPGDTGPYSTDGPPLGGSTPENYRYLVS